MEAIHLIRKTTIRIPEIYAWGLARDNPLGLGPFMLMNYIEDIWLPDPCFWWRFNTAERGHAWCRCRVRLQANGTNHVATFQDRFRPNWHFAYSRHDILDGQAPIDLEDA